MSRIICVPQPISGSGPLSCAVVATGARVVTLWPRAMNHQTGIQRPPVQIVMIRWNVLLIGWGLVVTEVISVFGILLISCVDATNHLSRGCHKSRDGHAWC